MICGKLIDQARQSYRNSFRSEAGHLVHAPGRVNLIGEHTDYNDGFVLPMAIDYGTVIATGESEDGQMHAVAANFDNARDSFALIPPITANPDIGWTDHIRGVAHILQKRGANLLGANLAIAGNVPSGAGLSSSASLGVATGMAMATTSNLNELSPTDFALIAQQSENEFVGTACGIMDQLVSASAEAGAALMIDCRSLDCHAVKMPDDVSVLIIHSGVRRELADSKYNERRQQCEEVARHFGASALRDVSMEQLEAAQGDLDPVAFRRARHVISENERVLRAARALEEGDLTAMGDLMAASHISMRDDFEITTPKVDELVEIALDAIGAKGGARMTGGGFGGCIVSIMQADQLDRVSAYIAEHYQTPGGNAPQQIIAKPSAGAAVIER